MSSIIGIIEENQELYKPGYVDDCPTNDYEIAELRSSYALLKLYQTENSKLAKFIFNILKRINKLESKSSPTYKSLKDRLKEYSQMIDDSDFTKKSKKWNYPLINMKNFKDNPKDISKNLLAIYNYLKWYWFTINDQDIIPIITEQNPKSIPIIKIYAYINIIQQNFFKMGELVKATRYDTLSTEETSNWGISSVREYPNYLDNNDDGKLYKWIHPGRDRCRVNYFGTYGKLMKDALYSSNENKYGSVQCGISGSINFGYFLYFLSLAGQNYNIRQLKTQIMNIIKIVSIILVGDGGHNLREVLTGTALTIIPFHHFIEDLLLELENLGFTIKNIDELTEIPKKLCCQVITKLIQHNKVFKSQILKIETIFIWLVKYLYSQQKCMRLFYSLFTGFNPIGITENDLNDYDPTILNDKINSFKKSKKAIYTYLIVPMDKIKTDVSMKTMAQIFFALESNRYKLPLQQSFWDWPTEFYNMAIISKKVNHETNKWLETKLDDCSFGIPPDNKIPFAFKFKNSSKRKSRKPIKKSRKCIRGRRKSDSKCRRKPGPKRTQRKRKPKRSRKCKRGRRKSDGKCKRKPAPKQKSRKRLNDDYLCYVDLLKDETTCFKTSHKKGVKWLKNKSRKPKK
jgi:hypothetical protein